MFQSNKQLNPKWTQVGINIPQGLSSFEFDYAHVTSFQIITSNKSGFLGSSNFLANTDPFFDAIYAVAPTTRKIANVRGAVYGLNGISGSARAPLNLNIQQPLPPVPTTVTLAPGAGTWTAPAGVTSVDVAAIGGGGPGTSRTTSGLGGGGGGAEYAEETNVAVTPGNPYSYMSPLSANPGSNGDNATFTGDTVTVIAHGGKRAAVNGTGGGPGGTGSINSIHHDGGAGCTPTALGGGGGSSGGPTSAGNAATGVSGAPAVSGGGAGGNGGNASGTPGQIGGAPGGGGGGADSNSLALKNGGPGGPGSVTLTYTAQLPPFKSAIVHIPGPDAPDELVPYIAMGTPGAPYVPGNVFTPGQPVPVPSPPVAQGNARFGGTYTVAVVANHFDSPGNPRTITVQVSEWEYANAPAPSASCTVQRTLTPSAELSTLNNIVVVGELTLPLRDLPPDNTEMFYTVSISDTDVNDNYLDLFFLDTMGQTVILDETTPYAQYYIDEPSASRDLGLISETQFDRSTAVSAMDNVTVSGGPLTVEPGNNQMLAWCLEGAPALVAGYFPRWWVDRMV